ncbi:MAG TPA: peptidoglycan-binding protein [Gaiellaceae bacterium]|jgi:peptidoglycan hydrolase-like protein with peptidoglycan-binding domain|nr:peptidoglycan-binding protein [Gaiellaceae bacterium]
MRRLALLCATSVAALAPAAAANAGNPQIAGLQVALRAYGLYGGPIDAIAGPGTVRATKAFQRRKGLPVDGLAGPRTRRALGPLGRPLFGRRTLRRGAIGWDVSVLQFMLARRGQLVPVYGYFDRATERALRRYQRSRRLAADGIAGPITMAAIGRGRPALRPPTVRTRAVPIGVRWLLERWARTYGVSPGLVRALAWMESGYNPRLVSRAGARGVLQVLPSTHHYVEHVLLRRRVQPTVAGEIQVGIVFLRHLLREFRGNESLALAAWYQGPASVRRSGASPATRAFVADVLALRRRGV